MKKKSIVTLAILMILTTGCSQKSNKEQQTSTGKINLQKMYTVVINTLKESYGKDVEKIDDKEADSNKEKSDASKENGSKNENNPSSGKQSSENQPISKQKTTSQQSKSESNNEKSQQQKPPKQEITQPPKQEPSKPDEPAKPKPPVPACDDTIPAGAYQDENVAAAYAEKQILDNLKNGDGSLTGYDIEYGQTTCGTKYYILNIY